MARKGPIIFLHVPKTGGSTLHNIIFRLYRKKDLHLVLNNRQAIAFHDLPMEERSRFKVMQGHQAFGHHTAFPKPEEVQYISILRNPIDRVLSHYYYVLARPQHPYHDRVKEQCNDVVDFVSSGLVNHIENLQVRMLSGNVDVPHGSVTREMLEQAKANIENFDVIIGVQDYYDEYLMLLKQQLGWRQPYYAKARVNKKRKRVDELDERSLNAIRKYSELDMELYAFVKERFERQWEVGQERNERMLRRFRWQNHILSRLVLIKRKVWS